MKSLILFLQEILADAEIWCRTSTTSDFQTIQRRVEHEGLSFLTITLPNFGQDLQKALDQGFVSDDLFAGFKRKGGLPQFLGGFLRLVFDSKKGCLLSEPSIEVIRTLRQITLMWAKINVPCSDTRVVSAIRRYVECEKDLRESHEHLSSKDLEEFCRIGNLLWADSLSRADKSVYDKGIIPKHGPGATADRLKGNSKWRQTEWSERLDRVFPFGEHLASSWRFFQDLANVSILEPGAERPVRVITVPKTLKSPRIIAIEPSCMQYVQQGLLATIEKSIQADDRAWTFIGWASQVPNQHLAWKGSKYQTLATLDLSEASDRVSNQLVRLLFRNFGTLADSIDSSRSRKADVPGHGVIRLAKFASMGSALCFPIESMVFLTLVFVGIERELRHPISQKEISSFLGKVRVYGDDIVIPVEYVQSVSNVLSTFGLKVNVDKSFWNGKFRESCGKDYYDGEDVTVIKVRNLFPTSLTDGSKIISALSLRNQLYFVGFWRSVSFLDRMLEGILPLPYISERSSMLGRHSFLGLEPAEKMCPNLHRPLVKGGRIRSNLPASQLEDYGALLKCLIRLESREMLDFSDEFTSLPGSDISHLTHSGRPLSVDIKIGWGYSD